MGVRSVDGALCESLGAEAHKHWLGALSRTNRRPVILRGRSGLSLVIQAHAVPSPVIYLAVALCAAAPSQPAQVTSVRMGVDAETGRSRGFAHVDFADASMAQKAMSMKNGSELDGRALKVDISQPRQAR
jgi:RNA recognition motif-containing protein